MEITTTDLANVAGISMAYASQIRSGQRSPSRPLAIHIFRKTGFKHPTICQLTDEQLSVLEQVEPWKSAA
jgi:transcriptional regulator with XRE-family HTH domain